MKVEIECNETKPKNQTSQSYIEEIYRINLMLTCLMSVRITTRKANGQD